MLQKCAEPAGVPPCFLSKSAESIENKRVNFYDVQKSTQEYQTKGLTIWRCLRESARAQAHEKKSFVPGNEVREGRVARRKAQVNPSLSDHDIYRNQEGERVLIRPVSDYAIQRPPRRGQGSHDQGGAAKQLPDGTLRDQEPPEPR